MDQKFPTPEEPRVAILRFEGDMIRHEDESVELIVRELIENKCRRFVFDFNHVTFMDSAGIGLIIKMASIIERHFGELLLCNPQSNVRNVFNMLGIDTRFKIIDNLLDALFEISRVMRVEIIVVKWV